MHREADMNDEARAELLRLVEWCRARILSADDEIGHVEHYKQGYTAAMEEVIETLLALTRSAHLGL